MSTDALREAAQEAMRVHFGHAAGCSSSAHGPYSEICSCGLAEARRRVNEYIRALIAAEREVAELRELLREIRELPRDDTSPEVFYFGVQRIIDRGAANREERGDG